MGTGTINSKKRYLTSLKEKHRELDNEVTMLYSKHISDDIIKPLKQKKLYLKQQIMELTTEIKEMIK
jgi:hypothetical protein